MLMTVLDTPRPINEVEAVEAWIKKSWFALGVDSLDQRIRARFAEFFFRLGVLPKYKSYGVKYATPFGYSIFDLQDGCGFSVQLHETDKVEAFHILGVHSCAFILLCTLEEWTEDGFEMLRLWDAGLPEASRLVYRPAPGDVVLVESLNTVHTVVGCLLEEFATSSYDVVRRLHDQNKNRRVILPAHHRKLGAVLGDATSLDPQRRVQRQGQWTDARISGQAPELVSLRNQGLAAKRVRLSGLPVVGSVAPTSVITVVVLSGIIHLQVEGAAFEMAAGGTTALAPNSRYKVFTDGRESCISLCEVSLDIAFADLRAQSPNGKTG